MNIGVPKEIPTTAHRVGMTPRGVLRLPQLPLPPAIGKGSLWMQFFVIDPAAANGLFTATNGVEVRIR